VPLYAPSESETGWEHLLHDLADSPEYEFYRSLILEELADALEVLPEAQQEVFILNVIEGMTFREISEMTGLSINTLLSRKRYSVTFLRSRLQEIYEIINALK
jgi:RNA polymerase sigma factor (sigma-70 family)